MGLYIETTDFWKATYVMWLIPEGMEVTVKTWAHYQFLWALCLLSVIGLIVLLAVTRRKVINTEWYSAYKLTGKLESDHNYSIREIV